MGITYSRDPVPFHVKLPWIRLPLVAVILHCVHIAMPLMFFSVSGDERILTDSSNTLPTRLSIFSTLSVSPTRWFVVIDQDTRPAI